MGESIVLRYDATDATVESAFASMLTVVRVSMTNLWDPSTLIDTGRGMTVHSNGAGLGAGVVVG
jgi:hypothetical protein